jgi:hypothetical protein
MILVSFLVGRLPYASGRDVSGESVFLSLRVYLDLCWVVGGGCRDKEYK